MCRRKILIIEDEPDLRLILEMSIRHAGTFDVVLASDGIEGMEVAQRELPDLILIDALMPRMDGYAACKQIKHDDTLKNIPVIFLTAKTDRKEIDRAIKAGASGFLPKPFDPLKLSDQIEEIIREAATT